jgi:hypothetical protein
MSPSMSIHFSANARPGLRSSGGVKAARKAYGSLMTSVKRASSSDPSVVPSHSRTANPEMNWEPNISRKIAIERSTNVAPA